MGADVTPASIAIAERPAERAHKLYGGELVRSCGLLSVLREDFVNHGRRPDCPGFWAIATYRFGSWSRAIAFPPFRFVSRVLYWLSFIFVRNFCGIELRDTIRVGRRLHIGHQSGIVIHENATIGDDCTIRQNVTFGSGVDWTPGIGPVIGDRVSFGPGAVVIGNVTIGDDVRIGPNCTITTNIPSNRTVFAPPPRVLPRKLDQETE